MILRSVMRHVRDQDWFTVGLDFLIVVLGILLAFQIMEWSAERQQRIAEARYLTELSDRIRACQSGICSGFAGILRGPHLQRLLV